MSNRGCQIARVPFDGKFVRLFDYDCDGLISAQGPDKIEIETAVGKIIPQNTAQFFDKLGFAPEAKFDVAQAEEFFGHLHQFSESVEKNPQYPVVQSYFGAIYTSCALQHLGCRFSTVSELIQTRFIKEEALTKANRLLASATTASNEFLDGPDAQKAVLAMQFMLEEKVYEGYSQLLSAAYFFGAFEEKSVALETATARYDLYRRQILALHRTIIEKEKELHVLAHSIDRRFINLIMGADTVENGVMKRTLDPETFSLLKNRVNDEQKLSAILQNVKNLRQKLNDFQQLYPELVAQMDENSASFDGEASFNFNYARGIAYHNNWSQPWLVECFPGRLQKLGWPVSSFRFGPLLANK